MTMQLEETIGRYLSSLTESGEPEQAKLADWIERIDINDSRAIFSSRRDCVVISGTVPMKGIALLRDLFEEKLSAQAVLNRLSDNEYNWSLATMTILSLIQRKVLACSGETLSKNESLESAFVPLLQDYEVGIICSDDTYILVAPALSRLGSHIYKYSPADFISAKNCAKDNSIPNSNIEDLDVVLFIDDYLNISQLSEIDYFCRKLHIPLIPAISIPQICLIGPILGLPFSPCTSCYSRRLKDTNYLENSRLDISRATVSTLDRLRLSASISSALGILMNEVINLFIGSERCNSYGTVISIELSEASVEHHRVLSIPDCETCFPTSTPRRTWAKRY